MLISNNLLQALNEDSAEELSESYDYDLEEVLKENRLAIPFALADGSRAE